MKRNCTFDEILEPYEDIERNYITLSVRRKIEYAVDEYRKYALENVKFTVGERKGTDIFACCIPAFEEKFFRIEHKKGE